MVYFPTCLGSCGQHYLKTGNSMNCLHSRHIAHSYRLVGHSWRTSLLHDIEKQCFCYIMLYPCNLSSLYMSWHGMAIPQAKNIVCIPSYSHVFSPYIPVLFHEISFNRTFTIVIIAINPGDWSYHPVLLIPCYRHMRPHIIPHSSRCLVGEVLP